MRWSRLNPGVSVDVRAEGSDRAERPDDRMRSRRDSLDNAARLEQLLFPE
jgi:hypothetical protein